MKARILNEMRERQSEVGNPQRRKVLAEKAPFLYQGSGLLMQVFSQHLVTQEVILSNKDTIPDTQVVVIDIHDILSSQKRDVILCLKKNCLK